jgi:integrase/recombinase XerD
MHHKELPYTVTLSEQKEKDVADKVKLALGHLHIPVCESLLMDRARISEQNAAVLADYIISMKREINPRGSYVKNNIQFLFELSRFVGIEKRFEDFTKYDILSYLDSLRKSENDDPIHKWIGSYNVKSEAILRFYKWLYYQNIEDPKKRNELSKLEAKPECITGIRLLKRKEISCYKPSDLWTQEDDKLFLKWVTSKRDRCYHIVARDLSARPHEILGIKIRDVVFKNANNYQYAEILVNGKTGSRQLPLIQSIPYVKEWLSEHPSRNNTNSRLFVALSNRSRGKPITVGGLYQIYKYYKDEFFPTLLNDPSIPTEDREKIKVLLTKPFNPYIRRHSAISEKSKTLKLHTLTQHCGWTFNSRMPQKYIHYFANESSESLLEAYGIVTKNNIPITSLNPKICSQCGASNTQDSRFCSTCKMILSYEGYQDILDEQKKKEDKLKQIEEKFNLMQSQMQTLLSVFSSINTQEGKQEIAKELILKGIYKDEK